MTELGGCGEENDERAEEPAPALGSRVVVLTPSTLEELHLVAFARPGCWGMAYQSRLVRILRCVLRSESCQLFLKSLLSLFSSLVGGGQVTAALGAGGGGCHGGLAISSCQPERMGRLRTEGKAEQIFVAVVVCSH